MVHLQEQGWALGKWEAFKKALLREFAPPGMIMCKVAMFKSMKLGMALKVHVLPL